MTIYHHEKKKKSHANTHKVLEFFSTIFYILKSLNDNSL